MNPYVPFESFTVKNYMCIGNITLSFEESPIIALIGLNDVGKSALIRGIATLLYNHDARSQKEYIRDDTAGFGIQGKLTDGTKITRIKKDSINSYSLEVPGKDTWSISKLDGSDVPPNIEKVLGVSRESETKEYLHYRTYDDKLLFVRTPASVNYNVMYNALKITRIYQAIKEGSVEVNELKKEIDEEGNRIRIYKQRLASIKEIDVSPLTTIKTRLQKQLPIMDIIKEVNEVWEIKKGIESKIKRFQKLKDTLIDTSEVTLLEKIQRQSGLVVDTDEIVGKLSKIDNLRKKEIQEVELLRRIEEAYDRGSEAKSETIKYSKLEQCKKINSKELDILVQISNVPKIVENEYASLNSLNAVNTNEVGLLAKMTNDIQIIKDTEQKLNSYKDKEKELRQKIKDTGVELIQCTNCGEYVLVSSDTAGGHCENE